MTDSSPGLARKVLIVQGVLACAAVTAMAIREFPGLIREIRMWRMASPKRSTSGGRRSRP